MTTIEVTEHDLVVGVSGWDKLWALKSRLTIPLTHVPGATAGASTAAEGPGLRLPGTRIPGVITAGTFRQDGEWVFWDVHNPAKAIIVTLADERYAKLVIEVEDPEAAVAAINRAVATRAA